jgi:hypothetical protein
VSWSFVLRSEARAALGRLRQADPVGARLIAAAMRVLSKDPRPARVHVLCAGEGLHRLHLSRQDPSTGAKTEYRVMYLIDDEQTTVTVILVDSLPPRGRRR